MGHIDKVLWALDNEIQPRDFERLCIDLLVREGYCHIVPVGGNHDHGRDGEYRYWSGASKNHLVAAFQFSKQKTWEKKLREDAKKIAAHCPNAVEMVFVTSQDISGTKQDELRKEFKTQRGWTFTAYTREWLRHRLTEFSQDLAKKYFGLDMPHTVGFVATMVELSEADEDKLAGLFRQTSPELVRASILESTRKEPFEVNNWYKLAKIEFILRDFKAALDSVNKALALKPIDGLLLLNILNLKGAALAELGRQNQSRPLLVEARTIFTSSVGLFKRAIDHYNLASVLAELGEPDEAEKHYLRCLDLKPDHAKAWNQLGRVFIRKDQIERGVECFNNAIQHNANLVEAQLSLATTLLLFYKKPAEAIRCFEVAYNISPELDRKWKYSRYWFSMALLEDGRAEESLAQIETGLALWQDDIYFLNQKVLILSHLRTKSKVYEDQAVKFLEFRAHALPQDYQGLAELIEILTQRGYPDNAWPHIDANLVCKPFTISNIAKTLGIPVADYYSGFQNAQLYHVFRQKYELEDHCVTLYRYGLSPDTAMLAAINYSLIAPFGLLVREMRGARENGTKSEFQQLFEGTLITVCRLFTLFGTHWLAKAKPKEQEEQCKLLSIGMIYLIDIIVAETARMYGFIAGCNGIPDDIVRSSRKEDWSDVRVETGIRLFDQVSKDWGMGKQNK